MVGRDHRLATERRVARLEEALRPTFAALPQEDGRIGATSVRYLLHRVFVQRHGWFILGLDAKGEAWNSSSPSEVFESLNTHQHIRSVFDDKLSGKGFDLHHVAVFAATLENLIHTESIERLQASYRLLDLPTSGKLSEQDAENVVRTYMILFVLSLDFGVLSKQEFELNANDILEIYPTWPDTEVFVAEVRNNVLADVEIGERTSWNSTLKVLEEVGERYGRWQNKECHDLKRTLLKMEKAGTGRVPLEIFYADALSNTSWQFMESVPYLRQLGALDESDPERVSVIIPNYVNAESNCVASSKFYSVCCIDECEELLGSLERHTGSPDAAPALILQLVSGLPSDTIEAPRKLSVTLMDRLYEIASHHGGRVPLHGRLFAQWLHHAYPRECPYPHLSGTTSPLLAEQYVAKTGVEAEATHDEIREIIEKSKKLAAISKEAEELPWSVEEELFVHRNAPKQGTSRSVRQGVTVVVSSASLALFLLRLRSTVVDAFSSDTTGHYKYV
jgi:hypothetical protein